MKTLFSIRFMLLLTIAVLPLFHGVAFAQQTNLPADNLPNEKIVEKTMASVVMVLTGKGSGILDKFGSGVIIRGDGIILTAYHIVKDASQVQIRLKNGEIYDKVDLIGYDERRDAAVLRISATNLPAVPVGSEAARIGGKVFVISNPQSLSWTVTDGLLNAERMADEIPGAGHGFKVLQFSAPVSAGSSGGLLTDETGRAVGLITFSLAAGQNLNFAVPLASVTGLAASSQTALSFSRGETLELPQAVRPPTSVDILNANPKAILHNAKLFYIYSDSVLISDDMMQNALMKKPEFAKWALKIVNKSEAADILIYVKHDLFTWDYRYSMTDRRTDILLASGKVTVWDGKIASKKFAGFIIAKLKQLQPATHDDKEKAEAENKTEK